MALPTFVTAGTPQASATVAVSPAWPTHLVNDIALLLVATANEAITLTTAAGFVETANSPQGINVAGGASSARITAYWCRATGTSMGAPTVAFPGNHVYARILTFRGCETTGDPWNITAGNTLTPASTTITIPGGTTTVADCLIVAICAHHIDQNVAQSSGEANADLANVTERADEGTNLGNGSGIVVITGEKATAGTFGATTATLLVTGIQGRLMIALKPPGAAAQGVTNGTIASGAQIFAPAVYGQPNQVFDSFTDTAGTLLSAHIGETGAQWTLNEGTSPKILAGGRVRPQGTDDTSHGLSPSGRPFTADYVASMDIYNSHGGATPYELDCILSVRVAGTDKVNWIYEGELRALYLFVNGVQEYSDAGPLAIATGTAKTLKIEVEGTTARCYWDGVLKHTETGIPAAAGKVDLNFYIAGATTVTDANALQVDNFTVGTLVAGAAQNVTAGTIASGSTLYPVTVTTVAITLAFACSGHCAWSGSTGVAPGNTAAAKHISAVINAGQISVTTLGGQPAWQFACSAARSYLSRAWQPDGSGPAIAVARSYVRFPTPLPDVSAGVLSFIPLASSIEYGVRFDQATSSLVCRAGAVDGGSVVIAANTTYRVDIRANVGGTSHTTEAYVDGVLLATATRTGQTATVIDGLNWGLGTAGTLAVTGTVLVQRIAISAVAGDFPIGPGETAGLRPTSDGTHNISAVTDFKYNNTTNLGSTSPTDIYSYLDDALDNITDFISMHGAAGEYCEVQFGNLPSTVTRVNGVEAVGSHHSSGTGANSQSVWLRDGSSDGPVYDDADFSATTLHIVSKQFPVAPSGVAWTKTLVDAIRARFGTSRIGTPVTGSVPFIDGLVLEVDYTVAAGDQSVTNGTRASALTLFAATLIPQAVALSAGTIATTLALAAPAVAVGAVAVTGGTIASGAVARAPSAITVGAVSVTGGTIASGSVVFTAHAITAGPVAATTGTIASGSVATAPSTVTVGPTTVVGGTIAGTTFFPPTVIPQAIAVTGGTIAATTLAAPSVGAGAIAVTGGTIASGSALTAPALAVGAVTVVGSTIASGAVATGPAITVGAVTIVAGTVAAGSTLSPPAVILAGAQVLTDSTVDAGPWTDHLGGTTDLHSPLADVDTLTWDQSPFNPVNATMKLGLTNLPAPGVGEKLVLSVECEQR